jgi:hypothetical protein
VNLPDATATRLLEYQRDRVARGDRPHHALSTLALALAVVATDEPVGLRQIVAASGLSFQGALDALEEGAAAGVVVKVPVKKRTKYALAGMLCLVEQSSDNNALPSGATKQSNPVEQSVECSTEQSKENVSTQLLNSVDLPSRALSAANALPSRAIENGTPVALIGTEELRNIHEREINLSHGRSPMPEPGNGGGEGESQGRAGDPPKSGGRYVYPDAYERHFAAYGRQLRKLEGFRSWRKIDARDYPRVERAIANICRERGAEYRPYPERFFRREWEDWAEREGDTTTGGGAPEWMEALL